jgi:hypothetical protein
MATTPVHETAAGREKLRKEGKAMPGKGDSPGRYPIPNVEYLKKAIKAVGRGSGDHSVIRRYIMRRARALGATNLIPDNWNSDGSTS